MRSAFVKLKSGGYARRRTTVLDDKDFDEEEVPEPAEWVIDQVWLMTKAVAVASFVVFVLWGARSYA
jgi:hypothetical protein